MRNIKGLTKQETIQFFEWYLENGHGGWFCMHFVHFLNNDKLKYTELAERCWIFINDKIKEFKIKRAYNTDLCVGCSLFQNGKQRQDFARELLKHLKKNSYGRKNSNRFLYHRFL